MPIRPRTPMRSAKPGLLRHWTLWVWFALALVLSVAGVCLWKSGGWLIHEDKFDKVGWGVVLAGESRDCERSDAAIRLFQDGKLDTLVISACRVFKTRYSSEFMVDYYVQQGVPRDRVFEFRQDAYSTLEEARLLIRQFRLQNLDTVVIITSSFHTARTRRIFRKLAGGYPVVLVAAAEYNVYDPHAFWSNRESLKLWFGEWMKTLFTAYELAGTGPETDKSLYQGLTPDTASSHYAEEDPSGSADDPAADSLTPLKDAGADSAAGGSGAVLPAADSAMGAALEGKQDAKAVLDSAAKADSIQNRKDSIKAHKDSVRAKAAEDKAAATARDADRKAEAKAAAKEAETKKTIPKAAKKPAAAPSKSETKKSASSKENSKASDRKTEKTRPRN